MTVTLDRTLRHLERDALGRLRSDVTYVLDPSPRSHNVLSGRDQGRRAARSSPAPSIIDGDMPFYPQIDLKNAHMRMHSEPAASSSATGAATPTGTVGLHVHRASGERRDGVGFYRALEKLADADPDPVTGKNQMISTTWRMEAVPAFLATDGRQGRGDGLAATGSAARCSDAGVERRVAR